VIGVVEFFNRFDGHGQILGRDHRPYRTHRKEFTGLKVLNTGDVVEFDVLEHPRGLRAVRVRRCETSGAAQ